LTPFQRRFAARLLHAGGIVACPTEAVFGLSCDPLQRSAVQRLLAIKQRNVAKGLILVAASLEQLPDFVSLPAANRDRIVKSWPGPATWLLPASADAPAWIRGEHHTIAVRVTAHPAMAALCECFGGCLVSTSANLAGRPPARTPLRVRLQLGDGPDLVLHADLGTAAKPTGIRDAVTGAVIR
jgi:L-threonylcarbamoyladenylate synthase